jgi:flagellar biosynthesis protein FlhG
MREHDAGRPQVWSVAGGKGGTGKSLLAASLAIHLAGTGRRVVLLDGDLGAPNLHTFLGIDPPPLAVSHVVRRDVESLDAAAVETGVPRLRLISGARNSLDAESLKHFQRTRLLRLIMDLPADIVIVDLGAGTSLNVVDLFSIADRGVMVILPEPTSVENCYRFLQAAFLRRLQHLSRVLDLKPVVDLVLEHRARAGLGRPGEILAEVGRIDAPSAAILRGHLEGFLPHLVVNQARDREDEHLGASMQAVADRLLGVALRFAGAIPHDPVLVRSVKNRRPYLLEYPRTRTADALRSAAEAIAWPELEPGPEETLVDSYLRLRRAFRSDSPALPSLEYEPERLAAIAEIDRSFRSLSRNVAAGPGRLSRMARAPLLKRAPSIG